MANNNKMAEYTFIFLQSLEYILLVIDRLYFKVATVIIFSVSLFCQLCYHLLYLLQVVFEFYGFILSWGLCVCDPGDWIQDLVQAKQALNCKVYPQLFSLFD